jgi:hypothetical protein
MTVTRPHALMTIVVSGAVLAGACGADERTTPDGAPTTTEPGVATSAQVLAGERVDPRSDVEQAFLAELAGLGLPTEMSADTTIEVGVGICRGLGDGADTETILDRIRPLTSAIAAQSPDLDTAAVGRTIVDASRDHLCR